MPARSASASTRWWTPAAEPKPGDRAYSVACHQHVGDRRAVEQELGRGQVDSRARVADGHRDREHVAVAEHRAVGGLQTPRVGAVVSGTVKTVLPDAPLPALSRSDHVSVWAP